MDLGQATRNPQYCKRRKAGRGTGNEATCVSEVHVILSPAENGPFLLVEATVCAGSATEGKQKMNEQKSLCTAPTLARSSNHEWA